MIYWFWSGSRSSSDHNIVDANLSVLRERVAKIKVKERLERCCRSDIYGWNYVPAAGDCKNKHELMRRRIRSDHRYSSLSELLEFAAIVGGSLGFTFFTGTFFLCVVSLFVHLNQSLWSSSWGGEDTAQDRPNHRGLI